MSISKSVRSATVPPALAVLWALVLVAPSTLPAQAAGSGACPDPSALAGGFDGPMAHVRYLADDALEGREVATAGARCAADYLASRFREIGLEPAADDGTYFQGFAVRVGTSAGPNNVLAAGDERYPAGEAWIPLGYSGSAEVQAELAYGGRGIHAPGASDGELPSGVEEDFQDRIVVLEAGEADGGSLHADPHFRATVAAGRGAAGVILLLPEGSTLPDPASELRGPMDVPVAAVRGSAAERVRGAARSGATATLRTDVSPRTAEARNVVALLPGTNPDLRDEWIVVGAHYDHLGLGGQGSLAPDRTGTVHNGADDNASGTAALVEAARLLQRRGGLARSVLFVAFTGEEKGLWGSTHYVREPLHPLDRTVAMINLDMVGRLGDDALTIYGTGTAEEWPDLLERAADALDESIPVTQVPDGSGPSDHASFRTAGVPALHFFTNTHPDYHRPEDDWEKVDAEGLDRVTGLLAEVTRHLAGDGRIAAAELTPVETSDAHAGAAAASDPGRDAPSSTSGYGPYLGTVPDMTPQDEGGVRLTGVRDGSPAERAGIRGGDVVVEFEDREIADLYAYTYALRDQQPGDTVRIVVEREGERVELEAVLEER